MTSTRHSTATRMICVLHNTGCSFTYRNMDHWPVKMSARTQWNIYFVWLYPNMQMTSTLSTRSIVIFVTLLNISHWFMVFTFFFFQSLQKLQNLDMKLAVAAQFNHSVWTSFPSTDNLSTEPRGPVWAGGSRCWGSRRPRRWARCNPSCTGSAPLRPGWGRRPVRLSPSSRGPGAPKGTRSGISQPVTTA